MEEREEMVIYYDDGKRRNVREEVSFCIDEAETKRG